ncbi:hypothetical protein ACIO93_42760 [Streptomyces sp. NPDC087903]|uniref:hypothetical protein n=1 Tax=Streptomyces sp. NPDC087903 TaxID=3365819 RepID=UPI0038308FF8
MLVVTSLHDPTADMVIGELNERHDPASRSKPLTWELTSGIGGYGTATLYRRGLGRTGLSRLK